MVDTPDSEAGTGDQEDIDSSVSSTKETESSNEEMDSFPEILYKSILIKRGKNISVSYDKTITTLIISKMNKIDI